MEEMYEVLKFIEHGTQCRQSMDCEKGTLLIYFLKETCGLEKEILFEWFRQIGISLDQYHRCRSGRRYRYLNPYSVVVAEDGKVYLLDLESPENETVMKKMQNRAIRRHFVKNSSSDNAGLEGDTDLYGYGKTLQFVLAYAQIVPDLTGREEKKLEKVIERCTRTARNSYRDVKQAAADIPSASKKKAGGQIKWRAAAGGLGILAVLGMFLIQNNPAGDRKTEYTSAENKTEKKDAQSHAAEKTMTDEEYISGAGRVLQLCLLQNTAEGNKQAILLGKELELDAVRSLAAVYEREEMTEQALLAYGRLMEIEESIKQIETAAEKKMNLEAEQGQYARAVLTGEEALAKAQDSEKIRELMEKYRDKTEGKDENDRIK